MLGGAGKKSCIDIDRDTGAGEGPETIGGNMTISRIASFGACLLALAVGTAHAETSDPPLVNNPAAYNWTIWGKGEHHGFIRDTEVPGGSAFHVEVDTRPADGHPWDIGVHTPTGADIHKGDPVVIAFWARSESGPVHFYAGARGDSDGSPDVAAATVDIDETWRLHYLEGTSPGDFAAGHVDLNLQVAGQKQTLDFGPVYILAGPTANRDMASESRLADIAVGSVEDFTIDNAAAGVTLAATLRMPAGQGPYPTVVLFSGHGPFTRNNDSVLTRALNANGIATLEYDKRGTGASTGHYDDAALSDLIDDAAKVTAWLQTRPEADPKHIGVLGGSEGGLIAPAIAAGNSSVSFVVALAGPAVSSDHILLTQVELQMKSAGAPEAQITQVLDMYRAGLASLKTANSDAEAEANLRTALAPYVVSGLITAEQVDGVVKGFAPRGIRELSKHDPQAVLRQVHVPVLAVFGSVDRQVPAADNMPAWRQGLEDNPDVTVVELQGYNHLFQHAKTGTVEEWSELKEAQGSDPEFLKLIVDWIKAHTR